MMDAHVTWAVIAAAIDEEIRAASLALETAPADDFRFIQGRLAGLRAARNMPESLRVSAAARADNAPTPI